jgi:hypothetical protein
VNTLLSALTGTVTDSVIALALRLGVRDRQSLPEGFIE